MVAIDKAQARWDWQPISFAHMSSHLHHGHIAGWMNPDRFFRSVNTRYAIHYHRSSDGSTLGPVFAERPKLFVVKPAHAARMVAYHHRNPVEAGVVARAKDSRWTSHRFFLRLDEPPHWLDVERALGSGTRRTGMAGLHC